MQGGNEDASCQLIYINGAPYMVALPQVQSGGQQQHQQIFAAHSPSRQPPHDALQPRYVVASLPQSSSSHSGGGGGGGSAGGVPARVAPLTFAQSIPSTAPSQLLVLQPTSANVSVPQPSANQTWVPVLASPSHAFYAEKSQQLQQQQQQQQQQQLPTYHSVVPAAPSVVDALQSMSLVSLPPSPSSASSAAAAKHDVFIGGSPLQAAPASAARLRGEQCLRSLTIHQRGTARLFVGQIHYDACEDDLHQIFGVYGHVLDVKIMRSGEGGAASPAATATAATASAVVAPASAASAFTGPVNNAPPTMPTAPPSSISASGHVPQPTAIVDGDSCNNSNLPNAVKAEGETSVAATTHGGGPLAVPPLTTATASNIASADASTSGAASGVGVSTPLKSNRRCNAFVTYSSMVEADMAISALHGRYVMGRDRPLQVTYCQATENISQFGFAHAVRLHKENRNNPLPFKSGAPTHR